MLSLAILTPNAFAEEGIEQLAQESGLFKVVFKASPATPAPVILRNLAVHDPEVILLDVGDWETIGPLAEQIRDSDFRAAVIGFGPGGNSPEHAFLAEAGIFHVVPEVFSPAELESAAYEAVHHKRPVTHSNILAFLPAKAGSGCSTVALNTAGVLAKSAHKKVLLIEADRRSGVLSIMLNVQPRHPLAEALAHISDMTQVEWNEYYLSLSSLHLLLADPARRGKSPTWVDYYHLLHFVQKQYDFVCIDLPEIVNEATAELVRSARGVFVVCTPEIPSLKMAGYRCAELEACEIRPENIHIVLNRWEPDRLSIEDVEKILERPVFGTVPNDYLKVKDAIVDSQLVTADSSFTDGCRKLAQKFGGLAEEPAPVKSKFASLLRLGRLAH